MLSASQSRSRIPQSAIRARSAPPLILSLGEPVAIEAVRLLRESLGPAAADFLDGGRMGLTLLHLLRWHLQIIVIDSVSFGGRPGDILRLHAADLPRFVHGNLPEHLALLFEVIRLLEAEDLQPRDFLFFAVQPGPAALDAAALAAAVAAQVHRWHIVV